MRDKKKDIDKANGARHLQRELDGVVEEMRQNVYKQIGKSNFWQKAERENGYKMIRAIDEFQGVLKKRISDGSVAEHKLKIAG